MDVQKDEADRAACELQYGYDRARELEQYKKAVEMCIVGGFLKREKFQEALSFVKEFHA